MEVNRMEMNRSGYKKRLHNNVTVGYKVRPPLEDRIFLPVVLALAKCFLWMLCLACRWDAFLSALFRVDRDPILQAICEQERGNHEHEAD